MNHFFALTLPLQIRDAAARTADHWRQALPADVQAQWYSPDDYHITLKFLGDMPPEQVQMLIPDAEQIAKQQAPFAMRLAPPGGFPDLHKPSVLWAGVGPNAALSHLASAIDEAMEQHGIAREGRRYQPHVTLARCRASRNAQTVRSPLYYEQTFPSWQTDGFALMQTTSPEQRRNGLKARYNIVHLFPFRTAPSSAE